MPLQPTSSTIITSIKWVTCATMALHLFPETHTNYHQDHSVVSSTVYVLGVYYMWQPYAWISVIISVWSFNIAPGHNTFLVSPLTVRISRNGFKVHAVSKACLQHFSLFIRGGDWMKWVVWLPLHMSRDYAMKPEPSALPGGSVSQWHTQRGWNRCPGVSVGPWFLHSSC